MWAFQGFCFSLDMDLQASCPALVCGTAQRFRMICAPISSAGEYAVMSVEQDTFSIPPHLSLCHLPLCHSLGRPSVLLAGTTCTADISVSVRMTELTPPDRQRASRIGDLREGKYEVQRGRVFTHWDAVEHEMKPPPGDYRDQLPPSMEEVAAYYAPVVKDGQWTFGLLEMWGHRARVAKSAVHVPCWEAFSWNPFKWRGLCFGRTCKECYWLGIDRTRWARTVYAAGLGREYTVPCSAVPEDDWRGRIAALCGFECCLTELFSFGFGQFVAPGGCGFNFASCYDWHSREKIRRKYNLPGTFVLVPPGCDDCLTHCFCMYCASHQEMRELAVRGVDGPGLHVLDVSEVSFKHLPGWEKAVAERAAVREELLRREVPIFLSTERRLYEEPGRAQQRAGRTPQPQEDPPCVFSLLSRTSDKRNFFEGMLYRQELWMCIPAALARGFLPKRK